MKDDWISILAMYSSYVFSDTKQKILEVEQKIAKHEKDSKEQRKQKNAYENKGKDADESDNMDAVWESDQSDYSLEDFSDLIGTFVEEGHVQRFYEKWLQEIQHDTHRIERVKVLKTEAENFYEGKGARGANLVENLDKMFADRTKMVDFKRKSIDEVESIKKDAKGRLMDTKRKFEKVRMLADREIRGSQNDGEENEKSTILGSAQLI